MPDRQALSEHVRRDTRLAYGYATLGTIQAIGGTAAIIICLFIAPHILMGLVVMPLLAASLLLIGLRPHRPAYRTRSWRLRADWRDGSLSRRNASRVVHADIALSEGSTPAARRRAARYWWGLRIAGLGQGAAVALTIGLAGAPLPAALAASMVWLVIAAIVLQLELQLYISAMHTLSLLDDLPERPS
jgi:hypothetical protein